MRLGSMSSIFALSYCSASLLRGARAYCRPQGLSSGIRAHYAYMTRRGAGLRNLAMSVGGGAEDGSGKRKKVVYLGTPDVAARVLELVLKASRDGRGGGFEVCSVVTQPPAPSGRKLKLTPSPVHTLAEAEGVPVLTPVKANEPAFLDALKALAPDLCITAAYGNFLPTSFLNIPKFGTLNIHPSLLPRYRGASPVQRTLEAGEAEAGVSVLLTVLKMDAGPIVRQLPYPLKGDEKAPELLLKLFELGTEQLIDALPSVWDKSCTMEAQDEDKATKADKISAAEAAICFQLDNARTIHNKVRAFASWPGTWSLFQVEGDSEPQRIKIVTTNVVSAEADQTKAVKKVECVGKALRVVCGDGSMLDLVEVQPPGKKVMDGKSFANGLRGRELRWCPQAPPAAS